MNVLPANHLSFEERPEGGGGGLLVVSSKKNLGAQNIWLGFFN